MKKKILHVITTLSVGGAEVHLWELLSGLSRAKYHIELAYFKEEAQEARSMVEDFRGLGIPVHDLGGTARLSAKALGGLFGLISKNRYDLVHSHLFRADLYASLALLFFPGIKLVNSVHNPEDFYTRKLVSLAARFAAARQSRTVVISKAVEAHLARHLKIPPLKMDLIYYGLKPKNKTGLDFRKEYGIPPEAPLVGTIGRLSRQKGHPVLIRAMTQVCREVPEARLIIVGHDDQGLRPDLEASIRALGLEGRVILAGFRDEVPDIMATLDLFCLPSLWEGFGMVLIEAMAEARPIVASSVGSIPEVVEDGETGVLVPPGDEAALAEAIINILKNLDLGESLGRAGRQRLEREFTREAMVRATEQLYDSLLAGGAR